MASGSPFPAWPWCSGPGGHRVISEGFLPGRGGLLLLRVRDHDGGVQVHCHQPAIRARSVLPGQRPRPLPCRRPGGPDRLQRPRQVRRECADQPGHHRIGRHRPGQLRLLPQHRDIGQAVPAQRHRRGQVRDDLPWIVDRPRRPPPGQALRQAPPKAGHPHRLPQQDRTCLGHQALPVRRHGDLACACVILHLESAFGSGTDRTLDKPYSPRSKALFSCK
jgi:hypothetical protein